MQLWSQYSGVLWSIHETIIVFTVLRLEYRSFANYFQWAALFKLNYMKYEFVTAQLNLSSNKHEFEVTRLLVGTYNTNSITTQTSKAPSDIIGSRFDFGQKFPVIFQLFNSSHLPGEYPYLRMVEFNPTVKRAFWYATYFGFDIIVNLPRLVLLPGSNRLLE